MSDPQITDLDGWIAALTRPAALTELAVLAVCVAAAWVLAAVADRAMGARDSRSILFGRKIVDGVLFRGCDFAGSPRFNVEIWDNFMASERHQGTTNVDFESCVFEASEACTIDTRS